MTVHVVDRITAAARRLLPWTLPIKLALGALLGALGGAGFVGYLSEYATYSYAIHFGFRPPLEGIPYLKATVTLGSFLLLITGAAVFSISILIIRMMLWSLEWASWPVLRISRLAPTSVRPGLDFRHVAARLATRPIWQILLAACAIALLAAPTGYYEAKILNEMIPGKPVDANFIAIALAIYGFLVTLAMANHKAVWWIAAIATTVYFSALIIVLFSPNRYAHFLRLVGYGGGLPVTLEIRDADYSQNYSKASYFLLLRTTEALMLLDAKSNTLVELPRDQVRRISHDNGGLLGLAYQLPAK